MAEAACHELNQPLPIMTELMSLQATNYKSDRERLALVIDQLKRVSRITSKNQNLIRYGTTEYLMGLIRPSIWIGHGKIDTKQQLCISGRPTR